MKFSRRSFLKGLFAGIAAVAIPVTALVKPKLTREQLIAQSLSTVEGRKALGQAMVEPIRRSLEYQSIGRKLLMVEELPQGAYARYQKDVCANAYPKARFDIVNRAQMKAKEAIQREEDIKIFNSINDIVRKAA